MTLFFKENELIKSHIKRKIINNKNIKEEEDYYIANPNWLNTFKSLFLYKEILINLNNNKTCITCKNIDDNILKKILEEISEKDKNKLLTLNKKDIIEKLCDNRLYEIFPNSFLLDGKNYSYFSQCGIIHQNILIYLKKWE